jgi:hypothetical protein
MILSLVLSRSSYCRIISAAPALSRHLCRETGRCSTATGLAPAHAFR